MLNTNQIAYKKVLLPDHRLKENGLRCQKSELCPSKVAFGDTFSVMEDSIRFDIKQLETEAKSLGVKASYGKNIFVAKLMNEALGDVKKAGYKLPKKIQYGGDAHRSGHSAYYLKGVIYLNPDYDWSTFQKNIEKNYKHGIISSDNPKHIFYHEIAHSIHARSNPIRFFMQMACPTPMNQYNRSSISSEVSGYASTSVFDFIAEVFAGRMSGKVYSESINETYNELGGPMPKKH